MQNVSSYVMIMDFLPDFFVFFYTFTVFLQSRYFDNLRGKALIKA